MLHCLSNEVTNIRCCAFCTCAQLFTSVSTWWYWPYGTISIHFGNGLVSASKCFRWPSGKAVWLWYSLTMTQHFVHERHNDGCLQVALTTRLCCTTHHTYMDDGLCLLTCKEFGLFLKSMSQKNFSSFGYYFRRLATLNSKHTTEDTHPPLTLFTSDQVSLYQLSKNWG